jgi:putative hemolysin
MFHTNETKEMVLDKIKHQMHSQYPVYDDQNKKLLGVVLLKQIVFEIKEDDFDYKKFIHQPNYIPEDTSAYDALQYFKKKRINYAVVTDKFGHIEGILSLNDILEALAGNADDFALDEATIIQREDGSWLVDGQYLFADFLHYFDMEDFMGEYSFNTMSGLILEELENIPKVGEKIKWNGFEFEVVDFPVLHQISSWVKNSIQALKQMEREYLNFHNV